MSATRRMRKRKEHHSKATDEAESSACRNANVEEFYNSNSCNYGSSSRINMASEESNNSNYPQMGSAHRCQSLLHAFDDIVADTDDIPEFLRAHKTTLRFPEMLLFLLVQAEREAAKSGRPPERACIGWNVNGMEIVIRNRDELVNQVLPVVFPKSKFPSFTRKLYRWGFRKVTNNTADINKSNNTPIRRGTTTKSRDMVFFHPLFQRDNKALAANLSSTTAEGVRRATMASQNLKSQESMSSEESLNAPIRRPICQDLISEAARCRGSKSDVSADSNNPSSHTIMPTSCIPHRLLFAHPPSHETENLVASSLVANNQIVFDPLLFSIIGTPTTASYSTLQMDISNNFITVPSSSLFQSFHQPSSLIVGNDQLLSLRQILMNPQQPGSILRDPDDHISPSLNWQFHS